MTKIRSMTGVGIASGKVGSKLYTAELYSVNNRYLDLSVRLPSQWSSFDVQTKKLAQKYLKRGKVNLTLSASSKDTEKNELKIDEDRLKAYYQKLNSFAKKLKLEPVGLRDLLRLPQVFESPKTDVSDETAWKSLEKILTSAFQSLQESREKEGDNLKKDLMSRLVTLGKLVENIAEESEKNLKTIHTKLLEKVKKLSEAAGADPDRLAREVAFLAERSDISEELVRFKSHLELFEKTVLKADELGKKLDFILQELNREVNTMGSKAGDFNIAKQVIEIKSEIEKIREQVQNLE